MNQLRPQETRCSDSCPINDVLSFVPDRAVRKVGARLRDVRNVVAHGHPPSWAVIAAIGDIWRRLVG